MKQESLHYIYSCYDEALKFKDVVDILDLEKKYEGKYIIFLYDSDTRRCIILHSYNKPTLELEIKRREYIRNKIPVHMVQIHRYK